MTESRRCLTILLSVAIASLATVVSSLPLGPDQAKTEERKGAMLFHSAQNCFQQWQSCASCHPDSTAGFTEEASFHEPVETGDCSACHAPHSSDNVFLMQTADVNELCTSCHEWREHSSHPLGEEVIDQRNANLALDCSSCHAPHGSEFKAMSHLDPGGDLCVSCHEQVAR